MPTILRVWPFSKKIMVHLKIEKYLYFKGNLSIYNLTEKKGDALQIETICC